MKRCDALRPARALLSAAQRKIVSPTIAAPELAARIFPLCSCSSSSHIVLPYFLFAPHVTMKMLGGASQQMQR